ncbi:BQ5605_C011g06391 [Microbotryum silenes-dioicae]|uniref:BQ5605_C011g06391 protein n=1 Tax=Microbotryum silenes-dioicae TaxID=796604 RepID=A0A2X0LSB2_9BASI|nr:BQ5605_C011g06391 [Microbotryum silenes-dioicae]
MAEEVVVEEPVLRKLAKRSNPYRPRQQRFGLLHDDRKPTCTVPDHSIGQASGGSIHRPRNPGGSGKVQSFDSATVAAGGGHQVKECTEPARHWHRAAIAQRRYAPSIFLPCR